MDPIGVRGKFPLPFGEALLFVVFGISVMFHLANVVIFASVVVVSSVTPIPPAGPSQAIIIAFLNSVCIPSHDEV